VNSDIYGRATFNDLAVALPGAYTLTASASGIGTGLAPAAGGSIVIGATNITEAAQALSVFLDSLQVEQYWENSKSVNWLTGAAGGSGPNMTIGTASHCSAFAAAAADVLGVYLLRPPEASDLNLANNQAVWLATNQSSGWYAIPLSTDAQHIANVGSLVVASLKEESGSGHIAVLRPSTKVRRRNPRQRPPGMPVRHLQLQRHGCEDGLRPARRLPGQGSLLWPRSYERHCYRQSRFRPGSLSNGVFRAQAVSIVGRRYKLQCTSNFVAWPTC